MDFLKLFLLSLFIFLSFGCEFQDNLLGGRPSIDADHGPSISGDELDTAVSINLTVDTSGPFNIGDTIDVVGSCEGEGSTIDVPSPDLSNLSPASLNCSCSGNPGFFNCGQFTVIGVPTGSLSLAAEIRNNDGDVSSDSFNIDFFQLIKQVYSASGVDQDISVPTGAVKVTIKVWGAGGGGGRAYSNVTNLGAAGAYTSAEFNVASLSSSNLKVVVGVGGGAWNNPAAQTNVYLNGGASGPGGTCVGGASGGGGGLVGVFTGSVLQANALIISGAGGGTTNSNGDPGSGNIGRSGLGGTQNIPATDGDDSIQSGAVDGGKAGTAVAGGAGGAGAFAGAAGFALGGGDANPGGDQCAGAGGAGYFGGGAGGSQGAFFDAAGGGGSGFVAAFGTIVLEEQGVGITAPNTADVDYVAGVSAGGAIDSAGGDGLIVLIWE